MCPGARCHRASVGLTAKGPHPITFRLARDEPLRRLPVLPTTAWALSSRRCHMMCNEPEPGWPLHCILDTEALGDPKARRLPCVPTIRLGDVTRTEPGPAAARASGSQESPASRRPLEGLMADVVLAHPYSLRPSFVLKARAQTKRFATHDRRAYAVQDPPRAFLPVAISTDGGLLRFL
eukprot:747376-Hanusia_phi.AAC.1